MNVEISIVPYIIKEELVVNYLYGDIFSSYRRLVGDITDKMFLYKIAHGFIPRIF